MDSTLNIAPAGEQLILERLAERKKEGRAEAKGRLEAIAQNMSPEWQDAMHRKIDAVRRLPATPKSKLPKVYELMEIVAEVRAPYLACQAGCNACCRTIPVEISDLEANRIASFTGRAPVALPPGRHTIQGNDARWVNVPCPFLKDDLCSIYEVRPYNCRSLGVVDVDALTCDPVNTALTRANDPRAVPVSMTKMQAFDPIYQELVTKPSTVWADIRQFFPV